MTNLAGRVLAYAYGSEAQAVALLDNLISGLVRERAQAAALQMELEVVPASVCCPTSAWVWASRSIRAA
jgi:hypothetical protein